MFYQTCATGHANLLDQASKMPDKDKGERPKGGRGGSSFRGGGRGDQTGSNTRGGFRGGRGRGGPPEPGVV